MAAVYNHPEKINIINEVVLSWFFKVNDITKVVSQHCTSEY